MDENTNIDLETQEDEEGKGKSNHTRSLLRAKLAPDKSILASAIQLAYNKNIRITKLADIILKDPIIALEILSKANTTYSSIDKAGITSVQTAIIRIGSENLSEIFSELDSREKIDDREVDKEFESLRKLSSRSGLVAEILANHLQKDISDTANTAAGLAYIGQMLCCKVLGRSYLEMTSLKRKNAIAYKLHANFQIDLHAIHLKYLKDQGLPTFLFYAYDKELKCKTSAQSSLRFITDSATEIVEAIEEGKWDKYKSVSNLPPQSYLRLLKITESTFEIIREEIQEIINPTQAPAKAKQDEFSIDAESSVEDMATPLAESSYTNEYIENSAKESPIFETFDFQSSEDEEEIEEDSEGYDYPDSEIHKIKINDYTKNELSVNSQALYGLMQSLCEEAISVTDLLKNILSVLIEQGPFTRAAIIELAPLNNRAQIHTAIGEDFEDLDENKSIDISDPLSPIALLATKIQSYNSGETPDPCSPFGISSYALSPITIDSKSPLILYADCGISKPVPLEARKVFRLVAQLLNEEISHIPEKP